MDSLERFIRAAPLPPSLPKNNNRSNNGDGNDGGNDAGADGNGIADNAGQGHRRALVHASLATAVGRKGRHLSGTFCLTGDTMEGIIQCLVFLKAFSVSFGQNKSFFQLKKKNLNFYHSLSQSCTGPRCPPSHTEWQRNYLEVYSKSFCQECAVCYVCEFVVRCVVGCSASGWWAQIKLVSVGSSLNESYHSHTVCQTCTQRKFLWFDEVHIVRLGALHIFFTYFSWHVVDHV